MGRIVIVMEEVCGDCRVPMGEDGYETDDLFSDSSLEGSAVKRRTKIKRCKKCQPAFEEKIEKLKKAGLVKVIPFGVSGRVTKDRLSTMRDFPGREKNRAKKEEVAHGNSH
ncbi:MAG: hypothetical protein AAB487_02825 [Patescibacteria group bacterium]